MVNGIESNQPDSRDLQHPANSELPANKGDLGGRTVTTGNQNSTLAQFIPNPTALPDSPNSKEISSMANKTAEFGGIDQLLKKPGVAESTYSSATFGIGSNIVGRTPGDPSTIEHLLQSANLTEDDVAGYEDLLLRNSTLEEKFMACKYLVGIKESKEALSELPQQDPLDASKILLHHEKIANMKKFLEFLKVGIPQLDENPQNPKPSLSAEGKNYLVSASLSADGKDYLVSINNDKEIKVSKDIYENGETRSGMLAKQASFKWPCSPVRWMDCSLNVMGQLLVDKFTHLKTSCRDLYNQFKDNVVGNKAVENNKHDDFYGVKDYYFDGDKRYPSVDSIEKIQGEKYAKLLEGKPEDMAIADWIGTKTYVGQNIQGKLMDYVIGAIETEENPSLYLDQISDTIKELAQFHQKKLIDPKVGGP